MYLRLSGTEGLKTSIDHPYSIGEYLYLMFDPTHNFKNAFNNWVNRKILSYPNGYPGIFTEKDMANFALFITRKKHIL